MRQSTALKLAICGTLLLALLLVAGRLLYIRLHTTDYETIAGDEPVASLVLRENDVAVRTVTARGELDALTGLLRACTYTEYPHLLPPSDGQTGGNRLTVVFPNGSTIGVTVDGYVFVNDRLRDVADGGGRALYRQLYALFYPNAG